MLYHVNKFGADAWLDTDSIDGIGPIRNFVTTEVEPDTEHYTLALSQGFVMFLHGATLTTERKHVAKKRFRRDDRATMAALEMELKATEFHQEIVELRNELLAIFKARVAG